LQKGGQSGIFDENGLVTRFDCSFTNGEMLCDKTKIDLLDSIEKYLILSNIFSMTLHT